MMHAHMHVDGWLKSSTSTQVQLSELLVSEYLYEEPYEIT